jgi:hypothetical protein
MKKLAVAILTESPLYWELPRNYLQCRICRKQAKEDDEVIELELGNIFTNIDTVIVNLANIGHICMDCFTIFVESKFYNLHEPEDD